MGLSDYLFGDDIFISYARKDGTAYASALAAHLTSIGYSCFLDVAEEPGTDLFVAQSNAIRRCRAMVVVASPMADGSASVQAQVRSFRRTHKRMAGDPGGDRLFIIGFDDPALGQSLSLQVFAGRVIHKEDLNALNDGKPAPQVIRGIEVGLQFQSHYRRLRQMTWTVVILFLLIIVAVSVTVTLKDSSNSALLFTVALSLICLLAGISIGFLLPGFVSLNRKSAAVSRVAHETVGAGATAFLRPFISYSHADKRFALLLEIALAQRGVRCWLDEKQLRPGDDIHTEIATAIDTRQGTGISVSLRHLGAVAESRCPHRFRVP